MNDGFKVVQGVCECGGGDVEGDLVEQLMDGAGTAFGVEGGVEHMFDVAAEVGAMGAGYSWVLIGEIEL